MKIIAYIMMGLGILGWISLYFIAVILKDNPNMDNILFITGYIVTIIFVGGFLLNGKFRKKAQENR